MTDAEGVPGELLLAGYAALSAEGFALPCYAATVRANAWHVARCSVPGDHAGLVEGFDLYDGGDVEPLPAGLVRGVRSGGPWIDVFLSGGSAHVGTAADLWDRLAPDADALGERVPLSLLALALAAGRDDMGPFVERVTDHMERRFGAGVASAWRLDALFAGEVRLAVRRALAAQGADADEIASARRVKLARRGGRLVAEVPAAVSAALVARGAAEAARKLVESVGDRLGERVQLEVEDEQVVASPAADPRPWSNKAWWPGEAVRILVVAAGSQAKAIARHVSVPDWVPVPHAPEALARWSVRRDRAALGDAPSEGSVVDVVNLEQLPTSFEGYAAIAWLFDDEVLLETDSNAFFEQIARMTGSEGAVHLLAPALPADLPSRAFATLASGRGSRIPFHCTVDTSLARSPMWTGNPWRAVDRRVADAAVGSALLCAVEGPIRAELLAASPGGGLLLSAALGDVGPDGADPGLGLVSESSATGLVRDGRDRVDAGFGVTGLEKSARGVSRGYASLRPADPDFGAFARAAFAMAVSPAVKPGAARGSSLGSFAKSSEAVPRAVLAALEAPELAATVEAAGSRPLVITAEAPTLDAISAGWDAGCAVVRYSDAETLRDAARLEGAPPLPRDMRLPTLRRLPENRGLAVRGVDPRDVVRLPAHAAERWLDRWGGSAAAGSARRYLARVSARMSGELAFPRAELLRLIADGDEPALLVADAAGQDAARLGGRPFKRPNDLGVAWRGPGGARRFVLEDGRLPAELMELPPGVVPAQRMFIVDGNLSVPLMLSSRLFAVWARATTSWSTSWLSRFSVSGTFETLPVPPCFRLLPGEDGRPVLQFADGMAELTDMAEWLEAAVNGERRWTRPPAGTPVSVDVEGTWREVDRVILGSIGLPAHASDADVLQRLVRPDARRRDLGSMEPAR